MANQGGHVDGQGEGHVEVADQEQASNQEIRRIVQESMKNILPGLLQEAIQSSAPGRRTPDLPLGSMPTRAVEGVLELDDEERDGNDMVQESQTTGSTGTTTVGKKAPTLPPPFILGEGLPAVPPKLVAKIQNGEFVDMAELLKDNMEADRRRASLGESVAVATILSGKSSRREIPDLLSWIQCFGTYACVLGAKHPELMQGLLAYQTFIVREARRSAGQGWREYDSMFRSHAQLATATKWGSVNNSLYAVTFGAPHQPASRSSSARATTCKWCHESDHDNSECALAPPAVTSTQAATSSWPPLQSRERSQGFQGGHGGEPRPRLASRSSRICYSWNSGRCRFDPYPCRFRHICSAQGCGGDHKLINCRPARPMGRGDHRENP